MSVVICLLTYVCTLIYVQRRESHNLFISYLGHAAKPPLRKKGGTETTGDSHNYFTGDISALSGDRPQPSNTTIPLHVAGATTLCKLRGHCFSAECFLADMRYRGYFTCIFRNFVTILWTTGSLGQTSRNEILITGRKTHNQLTVRIWENLENLCTKVYVCVFVS